jgi:acyl-CoA synthetase (NDP forming)
MYLESIKDGRRFLGLARRIVKKKPVIVLKSAVTAAGARASATHTGSLAGADEVYDAAFRQVGIIRVGGFEQLFDVATAFAHTPLPPGDRVAIVNLAGSGCVITVDACAKNGLRVAGLTPETIAAIKPLYPDWWRVRSPVDVWTAVEASGFEKAYTTITRAVLADRGVDAVIVILGANNWLPGRDVAPLFAGIKHDFPLKPILAAAPLGDRDIFNRMRRGFQEVGIPCYTSAEEAVFVLAALNRYRQILKTKTGR